MSLLSHQNIFPFTDIKRKYPVNIIPEDEIVFQRDIQKQFPTLHLNHYKNVSVTEVGIVFHNLKMYNELLVWQKHKKEFNLKYLLNVLLKNKRYRLDASEKYMLCFDYWSYGYYHWMCDFLPRLYLVRNEIKKNILLLPENYTMPFVDATLKVFDLKSIFRIPANSYVSCKHLLVPDRATESGENNPDIMIPIREMLLSYYSKSFKNNYPKKIYVSRAKARFRKVLNESEVTELVKKYEYEIVFFEEHSFQEQMALAYHADSMIGLHGAGLTNCMFMKPNTNMLELRKHNAQEYFFYFAIACSFGVNYYYQNCEIASTKVEANHYGDILVDINKLEENLQRMELC